MNSSPQIFHEEEGIDIRKYLFQILYHWWWFALSLFLAFTIAYTINRYSEKTYLANSSLIVGSENSSANNIESIVEDMTKSQTRPSKALIENEIGILKSYKMARSTIEQLDFGTTYKLIGRRGIAELNMYRSCPFIVFSDTEKTNQLNIPVNITLLSASRYRLDISKPYEKTQVLYFGEKFKSDNFNFTILPRNQEIINNTAVYPKKYAFILNDINGLSNKYRSAINISINHEKGSVLLLSLSGTNKDQISDYLNKLGEVYIQSNLIDKNSTSTNTIQFIDVQLTEIIDSLRSTGIRQQNFRSSNKLVDISQEGNILLAKLESLNSEKASIDLSARYIQYLKEYIESKKYNIEIIAPSLIGLQDPLLNSLVTQINELNTRKRNLQYDTKQGTLMLKAITVQIENLLNDITEILENLTQTNKIASNSIYVRISELEEEIKKLPGTERQFINIQRDFNLNDKIYTFLLQKRVEAGIAKASNKSNHQFLDVSKPENAILIKPKTSVNYMMALIAGALIPLLLIILIEYFNNKIVDRKYIEKFTSVPILGSVGHNEKSYELPVFENPKSALAESFRTMRTNLRYFLQEKDKKVILVTSSVSGEGKTFCAANMAAILAMAERKTLLISLDLRKPKIHRIFNIDNTGGISSYLSGICPLEKVIYSTNVHNLSVAVSGPTPPNPAELIESNGMKQFINEMKQSYDYLIIDTPPVAIVTDALLLKELVDIHVFVIRHGYSEMQVLHLIQDLYTKRGIKKMSLLINDVQTKGYDGYRYGYGYNFNYGYENGYYGDNTSNSNLLNRIMNVIKRDKL